jgi:hypothetical protein
VLDAPNNKKQLRRFLGFVNFYHQLWYHRSNIITPLAAITSDKTEWKWGLNNNKLTIDTINLSQNCIPGIKDKATSTGHYTNIHMDDIPIIIKRKDYCQF